MTEQQQKQFITDHYLEIPVKRMAKQIGRSSCFVSGFMKKQGLVVPTEIIEQRKKASQFQSGQTPFNKGLKQAQFMTKEAIERTKSTRFKKGNVPHNTKSDFDITIRKDSKGYRYYYIRLALAKWQPLHRYLWRLANGPIPRGHNIQFKDGDTLNCTLENLFMIDRQRQLVVNRNGGKRLPRELQKTILLIHEIKSKIKINEE